MSTAIHNNHHDDKDDQSKLNVSFLPVGATKRPPLNKYPLPSDVQSASDLPTRFYLGGIDGDSFEISSSGWLIRYQDADPDTFVELQYHADSQQLMAFFTWKGNFGLSSCAAGNSWKRLFQYVSMGFPQSWENEAIKMIESRYNAMWVKPPKRAQYFAGFPDGAFQTIVFPVPSLRLVELTRLFQAIDEDENIAATVVAYAVMTQTRIDYLQDRCPDVPLEPAELAAFSRKAVGLDCHGLPHVEQVENNLEITILNRWTYLVHVNCCFRDLFRVLSHCRDYDFIGEHKAGEEPSAYPCGEEWRAMVLPAGTDITGAKLQYFDRDKTRRIAYGTLIHSDRITDIDQVLDCSRETAFRQLSVAMLWSMSLPDITPPKRSTVSGRDSDLIH